MFRFYPFQPSAPLRKFVYSYLVSDVVDNNDFSDIHEALPMGITTLCFSDYSGSYYNRRNSTGNFVAAPDIAVVGQMLEKGESIFCRPFRSVVAFFKPTALFQLGGAPVNPLAGTYSVDATTFFSSKELSACREQMFQHGDRAKVVDVLDRFLLKKLMTSRYNARSIDLLAEYINSKMGNVSLDWLADQASMSIKTLERHFIEKVGITPKQFARVIRFKNAFRLLDNKISSLDVFKVVETCGYTDQPHLIKEFKQFAGRTPKFYYSHEEVLTPFFAELVSKNDGELL